MPSERVDAREASATTGRWLERLVFAIAAVALIAGAAGGQGWEASHAVRAVELDRPASAPLYGMLASVATLVPAGEVGFRLAVLGALLGALVLAGVARAVRALVPREPVAAPIAVVLLALAPPFRDAAAFAGPTLLAAAGITWAIACAAEREHDRRRRAATALAWVAVAIGGAPWLGALLGALVAAWLWRTRARASLPGALGVLGVTIALWWVGAVGRLPGADSDLAAAIAATARGSATVVVGAGLLGAAFAAVTGLRAARWLAGAIALAALHAAVVDPRPVALLALLAIGSAAIPAAAARVIASAAPARRHVVAAIAGAPLIGVALLAGPTLRVDDPGSDPARLAADLIDTQPPGPGVVFPRRALSWLAIEYAQRVAGARPDLELLPPMPATLADATAKRAMMTGLVTGSDVPAFGRLDTRLAIPRGRGFQLLLAPPEEVAPVLPPAPYRSAAGREQAILLAIDRARYEAVHGRLGAAARAAGLAERFGAADLAILSTTAPSRPALFGFLPRLDHDRPGPYLLDILGDDLAWSAGIDTPIVASPAERRLHGLWRAMLSGQLLPSDPAIAALGPAAIYATAEVIATFSRAAR